MLTYTVQSSHPGAPAPSSRSRAALASAWRKASFVLAAALLALTAPAFADDTDSPPGGGSGPVGPGDQLEVRIPGQKPMLLEVGTDGMVDLKNYGVVKVGGQPIGAAEDAIRKTLSKYIKVTGMVQLKRVSEGRLVLVTGKVVKPGTYRISRDADLWQAINKAGGPAEGADLTRVLVTRVERGNPVSLPAADVAAYLAGSSAVLPAIQYGDTIFVPSGGGMDADAGSAFLSEGAVVNKVFVLGAVARPGMYNRPRDLTALKALAMAGGPTSGADLSNVRVTTATGVNRLDLVAWLGGETSAAPTLPADGGGVILYVPAGTAEGTPDSGLGRHVTVLGGVNGQGRVSVRGPVSLVDLIAMAGGADDKGDLSSVQVVHRGAGYTIATEYDLADFMNEGGLLNGVFIHPGDAVYVNRSSALEVWQTVVGFIGNVAQVATAFAIFATIGQ